MSIWGSTNTGSSALPNAVDATAWPGAFNASTTPPATAGAFWTCPVLYPSQDCGRQPRLTPSQVTGLISNLSALAQCMGDYIAQRNGANLQMESCDTAAGSFTLLGTLMCEVIAKIQSQFDAIHPPAGITSSDGTIDVVASGIQNQNFALTARLANQTQTGVSRAATGPEAIAGVLSDAFISPQTLQAVIATLNDIKITGLTYNVATGQLTVTRSDGATFQIAITDVEVATAAAPATTTDPSIPTTFFGNNTARLGEPQQWFLLNGKKVPAYD